MLLGEDNLTSQVGVIILHVAAASLVQGLQLGLVGLGNVAKVLLVGAVHILRVGLALAITQVVPVGSGKGDLQVLDLILGHQTGQVLELVDIGAANMLDLAGTEDSLAGLVAGLEESGNVGGIRAEDVRVELGDLVETIQAREESTPEH